MESTVLKDSFGRKITYLRVSLTDRCNLRCMYCIPVHKFTYREKKELLTLEEIERLCRIFAELGISKIRFTGGEPLLRSGAISLMERVARFPGIREVVITTNGVFLKETALHLKRAGIKRVNVSLDSLDSGKFARITGSNVLREIIAGIDEALKCGLEVKLNTVVMKGVNDDELLNILKFAGSRKVKVRFVEFMQFSTRDGRAFFMGEEEILNKIRKGAHVAFLRKDGVESVYSISSPPLEFGIIPAHTGGFCEDCNKLRLTSEGKLRLCLYSPLGLNLKNLLRSGADDDTLKRSIQRAVVFKPRDGAGRYDRLFSTSMKGIGG